MTKEEFSKRYNEAEGLFIGSKLLRQAYSQHLSEIREFLKDFCEMHSDWFTLFQKCSYEDIVLDDIIVLYGSEIVHFKLAQNICGEDLEWESHQCTFDVLFEKIGKAK